VGLSPLYCGHFWPIVPAPDDRWGWLWSSWWNEDWQGKPKYSEKTCPSATLSTNPTWPDPGSNPGRRGGKPATNRLSYSATLLWDLLVPNNDRLLHLSCIWAALEVLQLCVWAVHNKLRLWKRKAALFITVFWFIAQINLMQSRLFFYAGRDGY
jgi:hypothetical protein